MVVDVIGQAVDVGDIEVVQVDQNIACCLWGRFAEQVLAAYKNAEENNILCLVRYAKINVYKGQVQITNAFETSSVVINPDGFDVQDYLRLPTNELALSTVTRDVVKPKGKKRQIDKWSLYPERSVLDIIMATECNFKKVTDITKRDVVPVKHLCIGKTWGADEIITEDDDTLTNVVSSDRSSGPVSLISIESEDNTCLSSTPLSKRRVDSDLDDLSSTSKKQCFKIIKVEKNNGE
ncbi:hypothetical protein YC2023_053495 [Brassica napus]